MTAGARADRPYDVVLLGATGFAGKLTADYLARAAPADARWALAGRNADKLAAVRDSLQGSATIDLLTADVTDETSLRRVADIIGRPSAPAESGDSSDFAGCRRVLW